ncbi:MAG: alpha/beta hydrolase [Lachnospiraceae bacterium]|nr:alpha/beta hydrolase [Lachnospiraceae bacterium]
MDPISKRYEKAFLQRFDQDGAIPYYSAEDFPGLQCTTDSFQNTAGVTIRYFIYHYEAYDRKKLILFCPGMGPGHTAYLAEIETLCRAGYRILTLDYTGCGASGGEKLTSVNAPTRDAMELLGLLQSKEEIIPVGHSLGGYTALNLAHLRPDVTRAVILSGFVSIADEMMGFVKLRFLANFVKRFEEKLDPEYGALDNREYLSSTTDKLLWIHSTDDPMVNYKYNAGQVSELGNPNVRVLTAEHKKHNPQYSAEALATMNAWIGEYGRLVKEKQLETLEAKKAFFADKPVARMTAQDPAVYEEILSFIGD